ncbi:MAG: hypothetical protein J5814_09305 [Bacteroidaceae bacterium]|nr:hypothetical protein [Bacteroidaceae bacterium]
MKKMMIALVAMFAMTMSANAQSNDNKGFSFERMSSYLELTIDQRKPVEIAMRQFTSSMEAFYQLEDTSKSAETWEKIQKNHKQKMKKLLSEKQYDNYVELFDLTVKNTAERMMSQDGQDTASL